MVKAVMISHFSRGGQGGLREKSLEALKDAGVEATVFESTVQNGSDVEVKRIAWHAIASGMGHDVLFFEDDITVNAKLLRAALSADKSNYDLVTLCLLRKSLIPDVEATGLVPISLDNWSADKGFHGSMGLWLSKELVSKIVASRLEFMREDGTHVTTPITPSELKRGKPCGFDFWLKDRVSSPAVMLPNPIGHRVGQVTTIG